ncbi:GTP pyrophosphokinase [Nocardioides sp.]|uniref:GTP pyrophosphokinase n=1 Tax=Nocardioides sp. TaxID=35761 RepID=UPI0039E3AE44
MIQQSDRSSAVLQRLMSSEFLGEDDEAVAQHLRELQREFTRFRLRYKFAIDELTTKIAILREEFEQTHDHNPIEHVRTRLKSPESIFAKAARLGCADSIPEIQRQIHDIAGVRLTCAFESDVYWIADMLTSQSDVTVIEVEDYIAHPKPNGYRSLHLLVEVPVYLSDHSEQVEVELQIRTIAMDFWASVEHKIYYKYDGEVPPGLLDELRVAAATAHDLDARMARLRSATQRRSGGPKSV